HEPASLWMQTAPPIATDDELPPGSEVVVAGAGLTGVATALLLARRGLRVTVVEARRVGAVTTGGTTGKLSLLQGSTLRASRDEAGDRAWRAYVEGSQVARPWLVDEIGGAPAFAQRVPAGTFATTPEGDQAIARERDAMQVCGLQTGDLP